MTITGLLPNKLSSNAHRCNVHEKQQNLRQHKRRKHPTKLYKTISNQDNSFTKTKKAFLIITGGKQETIFELKNTDRGSYFIDQSDSADIRKKPIPDKDLNNYKSVFHATNMDRRFSCNSKKNDMKKERKIELQNKEGSFQPNDTSNRNRVKIFGRIGLTEDDEYVMGCAATINDEPGIPISLYICSCILERLYLLLHCVRFIMIFFS